MKYVTTEVSGVITQISKGTDVEGYTEGILEIFFPDKQESFNWSKKKTNAWIKENNERMKAICHFLNEREK